MIGLPIALLVIFGPMVVFFLNIRRYKPPVTQLPPEQIKKHATKAKYFLYGSLTTLILFFVLPCLAVYLTGMKIITIDFVPPSNPVPLLWLFAATGLMCTLISATFGVKHAKLAGKASYSITQQLLAFLTHFGFLATNLLVVAGMAWGRPLRVAGKVLKPRLTTGDAWAHGEAPNTDHLDDSTKKALEALWLHDAKKEYASVPAFSRLGWQLAALAAPPNLLRDVHIAAIQEIEHTKKCFALATGFGSKTYTVLPIPEMLADTFRIKGDPFENIAVDSLIDGCLLEGFNADIAFHSIDICKDEASLKVIKQIAREERSHAELSWRIVQFCYQHNPSGVAEALNQEMNKFSTLQRPTASSSENLPILLNADAAQLMDYGRLPDSAFNAIWEDRIQDTQTRLLSLLGQASLGGQTEIDVLEKML